MYLSPIENLRLKSFLKKYMHLFSPNAQKFWEEEFDPEKEYLYDYVNQVYGYLFPRYIDKLHSIFLEYMLSKFPNLSQKQIIEVASGYIPTLSMQIIKSFQGMEHKITCYDPLALPIKAKGIKIEKTEFTSDTNIKDCNLIIAHCPCEILDAIVDQTIQNKTEMCVQTCTCGHSSYSFFNQHTFDYYIGSILDKLFVLEDEGFKIECEITEGYNKILAPAITVRKRKKEKNKVQA